MKPPFEFTGACLSATNSESQIIAVLLAGRDQWLPALLALLPDPVAFTDPERRILWRTCIAMLAAGKAVNVDSMRAELVRTQVLPDPLHVIVMHLGTHAIISQADAVWHAREVATAHARRLHVEAAELNLRAELDPADLAAEMRTRLVAVERINLQAGSGLPAPRPLASTLPEVARFDPLWLPASLRPWIADIAERMQCPADFPAVAALCALSSIAGRRFCIQPKARDESWFEFPSLWAMLIGRPSLMKSPAMQAAMRPLRALDREAGEVHELKERDRRAAHIRARMERSALEMKAKAAAKKGADFDYTVLVGDAEEPFPRRRLVVNDASLEALGEVLKDNPGGTLLYQDELAGLLAMMEREGSQALRAFLLQAWGGKEGFTFDRITRGMRRVEHCCIAILGSIQPGVIASAIRAANGHEAGADGFLQRFSLMVWPDMPRDWQHIDRPLDAEAEAEALRVFTTLEHITPEELFQLGASPGRDQVPTFHFAPDAQERFRAWHEDLEKRLRCDSLPHALEAHLAKYRKLVPALAVLTHVAEGRPGPVSMPALQAAIEWSRYLESHAARVYTSEAAPHHESAATLLRKLLHPGCALPPYFTARQVYRKGWSGLSNAEDAESACEALVDHHWLMATHVPPAERGGRPCWLYHLNPLAKK